jgi:uncharacterized linocin/CFP29 family protein
MNNNANKFTWDQTSVNNLVHDAANEARHVRPLLKLYGKQGDYTTYISGHQIKSHPLAKGSSTLSIPINQSLTPVILSCDFTLQQEQFSDADALNTLAVEAAYRVAAAEDAVILLGEDAHGFIERLGIKADREQLALQARLLPTGAKPLVGKERSILDSIVGGIADLEKTGRIGRYAAMVSLDLYQEAMKPRTNAMDAPIYEIRPLLIEGGFRHSQALAPRTGVIFSLSGDAVKIAVPVDTSVEFVEEKKDVFLQVVEQIRLVLDVPEAVVALR